MLSPLSGLKGVNAEAEPVSKSKKKLIKSNVTVHDRSQIETVFDYYISRAQDEPERATGRLRYRVETYLFFPRQFGINAFTYPKEKFYNDIRPMIRFREPRMGFKQLMGLSGDGGHSPLVFLQKYIAELADGTMSEPLTNAIFETRVFACCFVSFFLRSIDRRFKRLKKCSLSISADEQMAVGSNVLGRCLRLLDKVDAILSEFRSVMTAAAALPEDFMQPLKTELRLADEYCYYRLREGLADLLKLIDLLPERHSPELRIALIERITTTAAELDRHAEKHGYIVVTGGLTEELKESYVHRRGQLKRRIWGALFLHLRRRHLFTFQRQLGAMLAAGLAAFWAVTAQFVVIREAISGDMAELWGISGFLFITAAVLAYVVKDRIKEIGRSYFGGRLFRRIPDNSEGIYFNNAQGEQTRVGSLREFARFLSPADLPEDIRLLREENRTTMVGADELPAEILRYVKDITIRGDLKTVGRYRLRAVHDIFRLNINACLPHLADPMRSSNVIDAGGRLSAVKLPKVYYLDLILNYHKLDHTGVTEQRWTDYLRLVLDKTGLIRVERLV